MTRVGPTSSTLPARWLGCVILLWLALFIVRLAGPPNFTDKDQERPASYMMDAVLNGNWIVQRDFTGEITSKPPFYTWLGALVMLPGGEMNPLVVYLPTALATLGMTLMVLFAGARFWGAPAGMLGAVFYLSNPGVWKQIALARTDAVFSFAVAWAALEAWRAWRGGQSWWRFWLAASIATLTKGPLGLLLGAGGLMAAWLERRSGHAVAFSLKRFLLPGIFLWLALSFGWFALSLWDQGDDVYDKMIRRELVGHLAGGETSPGDVKPPPFASAHKPLLYFIGRFAPWSLLSLVGLWLVWKRPAQADAERRFERFLFGWFVVGLLIFSVAGHARGDLIFPLIPPGALLAGRIAARWLERRPKWSPFAVAVVIGCLGIAGAAGKYIVAQAKDERSLQTIALRDLAAELERDHPGLPLVHLDTPFAFQMYANNLVPVLRLEQAVALLAGEDAAWVTVENLERLRAALPDPEALHVLREIRIEGVPPFHLVSNRDSLELPERAASRFGPLYLVQQRLQLLDRTERELSFRADGLGGRLIVHNDGGRNPVTVKVRITDTPRGEVNEERTLAPDEVWVVAY
ncbi:MAG TPA: hypothetical protein DCY13_02415 [Verrucomicrobiales bacterium]|nr:hypothetical protein [Verrucomicrobiales bacterium]